MFAVVPLGDCGQGGAMGEGRDRLRAGALLDVGNPSFVQHGEPCPHPGGRGQVQDDPRSPLPQHRRSDGVATELSENGSDPVAAVLGPLEELPRGEVGRNAVRCRDRQAGHTRDLGDRMALAGQERRQDRRDPAGDRPRRGRAVSHGASRRITAGSCAAAGAAGGAGTGPREQPSSVRSRGRLPVGCARSARRRARGSRPPTPRACVRASRGRTA